MSERWKDYIAGGIADEGGPIPFALEQWAYLQPVFQAIRRVLPKGGRVLDVGCGAGVFTSLLAHHGYDSAGIDNDPEIVACGRQMAEFFRSTARIEQASADDLSAYHGRFDLVYSLGVVEHFDADVTTALIREQFRCAPIVLVAIPTRFTRFAEVVTDERFYSRRQFNHLIVNAGGEIRESFVFGNVPSTIGSTAHRLLPPKAHAGFRLLFTYAMQLCTVAQRANAIVD